MKGDSLTMDEQAHLPAGYSYLTQQDMRLNPEHPPLVKDLAAIPLLFIDGIHFPDDLKAWAEDLNGQWDFGRALIFDYGNPADKMIFWGRVPMILLLLLLGFLIFKWAKESFGNKTALLALFLFSFSPTLLAHGRLVTTDVGAALGMVMGIYFFLKALKNPSWKNIILSGVFLGIAELLKFTVIILIPFLVLLAFAWWIFVSKNFKQTAKVLLLSFILAFVVIGIGYSFHVWHYPLEKQISDIRTLQGDRQIPIIGGSFADPLVFMAENPVLRPYSQYFLGLFMNYQRGTGGNTTFFLGEISAAGWKTYFPTVYSLKEPLPLHILTILALLYLAWLAKEPFWKNRFANLKQWMKDHFIEFSMLAFVALYWAFSLYSNLNIGVRHLLPVFPFTFILVSLVITKWISSGSGKTLYAKYCLLGALLIWQAVSVISVYPSFLSYFNELAGGAKQGYLYVADSNLDWGQDVKRLAKWTDQITCYEPGGCQTIDKIYVDYFGGSDVEYYLKEKYEPWWGSRSPEELPPGSYLAVSATFLQGGRGLAAPGYDQPVGYYLWLNNYTPVAQIGNSIFVYRINQ